MAIEADDQEAIDNLIEAAKDRISSDIADRIEEELEDPIRYFVHDQGMYSIEDLLKAPFIYIDIDAAAQDAVDTDGRGHFLSGYDGEENDIDINGTTYFIYRTN